MHLPRPRHMSDERPSQKPIREPKSAEDAAREQDEPRTVKDPMSQAVAALDESSHAEALVELARATWVEHAASGRTVTLEEVREKAAAAGLAEEDAATALGNAIGVLGRGPEDDSERALGTILCARAIAHDWSSDDADDARLAAAAISLSAKTSFDVLGNLDRTLEGDGTRAWKAVAVRVRQFDRGEAKSMSRGEAAVACAALAQSTSTAAARVRSELRLHDSLLGRILSEPAAGASEKFELSGELLPVPRGPFATTLLAITGLLFVIHALRIIARLALVYRRPAEITLSNGGVRVRAKSTLLGRTLRESETHIPKEALAQATREIRYPSLGLYAGLLALAIGTYVGVGTLTDGVRSASPSLLLVGLIVIAVGIGLDLALTSAAPGARGRCRVVFVARKGRSLCVGGLDSKRADEALAVLKA